jgi:hypothetical protein
MAETAEIGKKEDFLCDLCGLGGKKGNGIGG